MGYFDAIASSSFKTLPDGRRLFFPWGVLGRGYAISSEAYYERLRRQVKTYTAVSLVIIIGVMTVQQYLWGFAAAGLLMVAYAGWASFQLRALQPTGERLSYRESLSTQAHLHNKTVLWLMEGVSLVYVAGGLIILRAQPDMWMVAVAVIVFFGACAVAIARMLILRSRQA